MEDLKTILKYREHRGSLDDSMATVREITSLDEVKDELNKFYAIINKSVAEIKTEYYCYDERINWDTYVVLFRLNGNKDFQIAGMANGCFGD